VPIRYLKPPDDRCLERRVSRSRVALPGALAWTGRSLCKGVALVATSGRLVRAASNGCYEAIRAAALSGVPKTTVYWWASHGIVVPSVSPVREKLWSYSDLMALRIVSWLRHPKSAGISGALPASPMPKVRRALSLLDELGLDLWDSYGVDESPLLVDARGEIYVRAGREILSLHKQPTLLDEHVLQLTAPFNEVGGDGPNLLRPRPHLRIVPFKVTGEPHIEHSRVTTQTVAALAEREFSVDRIAAMYEVSAEAVREGIDLERQLAGAALVA
jgi:uncharacterized protein (DUF433 family)